MTRRRFREAAVGFGHDEGPPGLDDAIASPVATRLTSCGRIDVAG